MADYVQINKYSTKGGELAISRKVFETIALDATNRVLGEDISSKKSKFKIYNPIKAVFKKNGDVTIKVSISLKRGVKPNDISLEIQKEIAHDLAAYVEQVPFDIEVSIDEIK